MATVSKKKKSKVIVWQPDNVTFSRADITALQYNILFIIMYSLRKCMINVQDYQNEGVQVTEQKMNEIIDKNITKKDGQIVIPLRVSDVCGNGNNRGDVEESLSAFMKVFVTFPYTSPLYGLGKNVGVVVYNYVFYKRGYVEIFLNRQIVPYFILYGTGQGNGFTRFRLDVALSLKSKHSKHLYAMLCSWVYKYHESLVMTLERFHEELGLPADYPGKKTRVILDYCRNEMRQYDDVWFEYELFYSEESDNRLPEGKKRKGNRPFNMIKITPRTTREIDAGDSLQEKKDDFFVTTFNAAQTVALYGGFYDITRAREVAEIIDGRFLCGKVAEKYRYYLDVKGSSTEDKREIARILWKIFQEEAGITLDRDGIPVTNTSL